MLVKYHYTEMKNIKRREYLMKKAVTLRHKYRVAEIISMMTLVNAERERSRLLLMRKRKADAKNQSYRRDPWH
jgi:hypothetical protein